MLSRLQFLSLKNAADCPFCVHVTLNEGCYFSIFFEFQRIMDDIDKLIEALRLNEKKFNEEEIRANSWKIFTNPEMSVEIEALYQRGLKLQEKRKKEEMERIMEEEIKLAKESWFEKSDDQDPFDELEKSIEELNDCFVQMENDFGHPSKLTTEKLEKAANDILEQKVANAIFNSLS